MIIADRGSVMIKGTRTELMAECTMILNELWKKKIVDKDDLLYSVELSTKTFEELEKDLNKARTEFLKNLMCEDDELKKLLKELEGMK